MVNVCSPGEVGEVVDDVSPGEALEADCVRARQKLGYVLLTIKHA